MLTGKINCYYYPANRVNVQATPIDLTVQAMAVKARKRVMVMTAKLTLQQGKP
jgi:hypothetical protein